jgi:hypothetical protein
LDEGGGEGGFGKRILNSNQIIMLHLLNNYRNQGTFRFSDTDKLSKVCNAPKNSSGLYLVFTEEEKFENIIYIGISGRDDDAGNIVHRQDGIYGRIVKGKQFGDRRQVTWPIEMQEIGVQEIIIHWYETYGELDHVFPRPIENALLELFESQFGHLPIWNLRT